MSSIVFFIILLLCAVLVIGSGPSRVDLPPNENQPITRPFEYMQNPRIEDDYVQKAVDKINGLAKDWEIESNVYQPLFSYQTQPQNIIFDLKKAA